VPGVADVVRRHGAAYLTRYGDRILQSHRKALSDIASCRTAAMGGHLWECPRCHRVEFRYHSCRNRACPKCHGRQTARWLEERRGELLAVPYFHVVFTVPDGLRRVIRSHQEALLGALMRAAAEALRELAAATRYLGGDIGMLAVLHTWTRTLEYHPHVHILVPGVAVGRDGEVRLARRSYLVPVRALSRLFMGKFFTLARKALPRHVELPYVRARRWVVYAKPTVSGADSTLQYLARYVFRQAITDRRIISDEGGIVAFRYRHDGTSRWRTMALPAEEFLRRFLQHVLPRGINKVRYYGLWHPARRQQLRSLQLLLGTGPSPDATSRSPTHGDEPYQPTCPHCGCDRMVRIGSLPHVPHVFAATTRAPPCHSSAVA
jgi:hypothetical protein